MFSRGSGILLHVSSLPALHGIGDLGPTAYRFADILHKASQSYWQVLPLNPTHPGSFNSPYFSSSATAGNPLLISLELLAQEGLLESDEINGTTFPHKEVDYPAVTAYKEPLLEEAFNRFSIRGEFDAFQRFCKKQAGWLDDFALFRTLKRQFNDIIWNLWPDGVKYRKPKALKNARAESREEIEREKWYQFVFFTQWETLKSYCNKRSIQIVGDMPIYVSFDSVDVWMHPELFKLDSSLNPIAVSGVPPDYFSVTGQLWNNPVYNWNTVKENGFQWWIDRMKAMFARFDIVRIDHFRGLVQYWEIPAVRYNKSS